MRTVVFLLLVANLAFYAWANGYLGNRAHPDAVRLDMQIAPERLAILSRGEPPPGATAPPLREPDQCVAWSGLSSETAASVSAVLAERFSDLVVTQKTTPGAASWWVLIPPQASKADTERKAGELRRLGISEYFIIQEEGPFRHAISLGLFSSEEAALRHLDALRAKGVRSARHEIKSSRPTTVTIEVRGAGSAIKAALDTIGQKWPDGVNSKCVGRSDEG